MNEVLLPQLLPMVEVRMTDDRFVLWVRGILGRVDRNEMREAEDGVARTLLVVLVFPLRRQLSEGASWPVEEAAYDEVPALGEMLTDVHHGRSDLQRGSDLVGAAKGAAHKHHMHLRGPLQR